MEERCGLLVGCVLVRVTLPIMERSLRGLSRLEGISPLRGKPLDMGDREKARRQESFAAGKASGIDNLTQEVIGETKRSRRGYFIRAIRVQFDTGGNRVRIELRQNEAFVRHLDITEELAFEFADLMNDVAYYLKGR